MKQKEQRILLIAVLILILAPTLFVYKVLVLQDYLSVGNIKCQEYLSVLVTDDSPHRTYALIESLTDSVKIPLSLTEYQRSNLILEGNVPGGQAYRLMIPVRGLETSLITLDSLGKEYLGVSDCLYSSNLLYEITTYPIEKHLDFTQYAPFETYRQMPIQDLLLVFKSHARAKYGRCRDYQQFLKAKYNAKLHQRHFLYSDSRYPGISLLYSKSGFSEEYINITQYPIILLNDKRRNDSELYRSGDDILIEDRRHILRHYRLFPYKSGYIIVAGHGEIDEYKDNIDELIRKSNLFIRQYLNVVGYN